MKDMKFRVKNPEHSKAIQERLFELGHKWASDDTEIRYVNSNYLYVGLRESRFGYITCGDNDWEQVTGKELTLDDLYEMTASKTVKLNDEYTAEIDQDGVKVGCSTFSFKAVKKLYKAVKDYEKNS